VRGCLGEVLETLLPELRDVFVERQVGLFERV